MMWDRVFLAVENTLLADAELVVELGLDDDGLVPIYRAQSSRKVIAPSVQIFGPVDDTEDEHFNPIIAQIDYWANGAPIKGATIERRIRQLLHRDVSRTLGGVWMWTLYLRTREHQFPTAGTVHRSVDFLFRPLREQYAATT